jgi:hypothetical protein
MMDAVLAKTAGASAEWRYALLGLLEAAATLRVCATEDLAQLIRQVRPRATADTVHGAIDGLVQAGALEKVSRGLYLNRRSRPAVEVAEAAQRIRQGALVSLESVLGECGFLNNPAAIVTAVVPQRQDYVPSVGQVKASGGQVFRFSALPDRFFPQSEADRHLMLQAGRPYPIAKPEVAVLHWLRLALSPRSSMRAPPQDVDFGVLDSDLLKELAWRWELARPLEAWLQRHKLTGDIQEPSALKSHVSQEDRKRGLEARERMLARRKPGHS